MRFVLRMAAREIRASWKRLLFFFISISVGVASIVALRSVIQTVRYTLARESRALTAADILIRSDRPWSEESKAIFSERFAQQGVQGQMASLETTTMVQTEAEKGSMTTMVELRALEPEFPFYGKITLESGEDYRHELLAGQGVLVRGELLTRLGIEVGDRILIGGQPFTIRGAIIKEAGRSISMFSLGPRVLIDYADLDRTGLVRFGSRVRFQRLLKVEEQAIEPLIEQLREDFKGQYVRVRSFQQTGDRIGRRLQRAENYLSLAGFVILILGGIGVWSVVRVFVQQKLKSIAVLKCIGASTREILATYLFQVLGLGFAGSLLGVGLAQAVVSVIPPDSFGVEVEGISYGLTASAVAQGLGIGMLVSLLFSLVPLLEIKRVKPLLLLRPGSEVGAKLAGGRAGVRKALSLALERLDRRQVSAALLVLLALVGLATWQAGSLRAGAFVTLGFAGVAIALYLTGLALVKLVTPLSRRAWFPLRHAVINVSRPGNQTRVILLAVGLGVFFILTMHTIEINLLEQFNVELADDAPDMFLIDIQPDQEEPLRSVARSLGAAQIKLVPVLRARVTGVDGREIQLDGYEEVREHHWLAREFVVTFRDYLESNERLQEGRLWDSSSAPEAEVSIEDSFVEDFGIQLGDTMHFDILGREVSARVTSVRDVEWSDSRNGGFMLVFRPGTLEGAPHTYLGFIKGPEDAAVRGRFQRDLISGFHNISIIDLRDILDTLREIVDKVSMAVSVVGAIALFSGGLILTGSVAMTRFQRRYETAIFRTLGASKKNVVIMMLLEYATLGALAGAVGAVCAVVMSWAMSSQLLEIAWSPVVPASFLAVVVAALGVATVGLTVTLDVLRHKPLAILRAE